MTVHTLDLQFQDMSRVIAGYLVSGSGDGFVVIEPGPARAIESLEASAGVAGFDLRDLRGVFVTHVHLDHAGAAGELSRRYDVPVYVHPAGAPHLADPSRLLSSAKRLYGERMDDLWGPMQSVPGDLVRPIEDDGVVTVNGIEVRALHTPGHARHHVAWLVEDAVATGDVGGVRFPGNECVLPPTPPPDIDVVAWRSSLERIGAQNPRQVLLTHFGPYDDIERHLSELEDTLAQWEAMARETVGEYEGRGALMKRLGAWEQAFLIRRVGTGTADLERYRMMCPTDMNVAGLARCFGTAEPGGPRG